MSTPNDLIAAMRRYEDEEYVWGGKDPKRDGGLDCSGIITLAMKDVGVDFPHGSWFQINEGIVKKLSVGDAIHTRGALLYRPGHVAISQGDGTTYEARNERQDIGSFSAQGRGWTRAGLLPVIGETMAQLTARALANARASIGKGGSYSGMCEKFVRTCFGFTAKYASAKIAWDHAGGKHHGDYNAPAGVPVFWDITSGKNVKYDHIALSVGGGYCVSTSAGKGGTVALVSIRDLTRRWGMTYRGWAEVYHGIRVYKAAAPKPKPAPKPITIKRLRVDGDFATLSVKALQLFLKRYGGHYLGYIDGHMGPLTIKGLQRYLKAGGRYKGRIDGKLGPMTVKALQEHLKHHGHYKGWVDGQFGPMTRRAFQDYLNRTMTS